MTPGARRMLHLLEIATVGFPFCAFKLLTGNLLAGYFDWRLLGWALTALGAVDLVLNMANFSLALVGRESPVALCTAEYVVGRLNRDSESHRQLGLSVDAMLSFTLVAAMVGLGLLVRLGRSDLALWNLCVVLNVLGAGLGRLADSLAGLRGPAAPSRS